MRVEIISIGDEILIGQIVNTNAAWMSQKLNIAGFEVVRISTVSDKKDDIILSINDAVKRVDVILLTGGLGPTKDDITKEALCEYFNTELIFNENAFQQVKTLFSVRGFEVTEINRKQAELPKSCTPIANHNGTAAGMWFNENGKIIVSMPGVPFEMKPMMTDSVIPELKKHFKTPVILHKTILTQCKGESFLAEIINDWENELPKNIKLAYLPQPGIVRLRLSAKGENAEILNKQVEAEVEKLKKIIPKYIFGYDDDKLEQIIGELLKEKKKTLSTAESCTGGYISHLITSVSGSSEYYLGSIISYSNEIKEYLLGVTKQSMIDYGVVSEQVITQMAKGVKEKLNTDYSIAVSGIAGPSGGSVEKPVGTMWIAIATPEKVIARKFLFGEHRERNIRKTALMALDMLRKEILTAKG
ncbi:MAG: competence/damage-inducible protein A [Bacteroidales bacterium]|nr:competence/damage-inducible protein A [Bacteroidales bacterium]